MPDVVSGQENDGRSTSIPAVSNREDARSAQQFRDLYADMVRKAEADLELEAVPVVYREYLRRYFRAIRPQEPADDGAGAAGAETEQPR